MTTNGLSSQLESLSKRAANVTDKIRTSEIHPTKKQLKKLKTWAADITQAAAKISEQIGALKIPRATGEGIKLLSQAQSSRKSAIDGQLNQATFRRNLCLIFEGPRDSALDSGQTKARKQVIRGRCETIRGLNPDTVITWAAAFPPTTWTAGTMSQDIFEHIISEVESEDIHAWPLVIYNILHTLGAEEPLCRCGNYQSFVRAVDNRARPLLSPGDPDKPDQRPQKRPRTEQEITSMKDSTGTRARQGIEMAYVVAPEVWDKIYEGLCQERVARELAGEPQSIILTIPAEDRVGMIMHSIPRRMAMKCSKEYNLPKIPF